VTLINDNNQLIIVDNGSNDKTIIYDNQIVYVVNNGGDNSFLIGG